MDEFGHPVQLRYKNHGGMYSTALGGFMTILMYAIIALFAYQRTYNTIMRKNPNVGTHYMPLDYDKVANKSLAELNFMPYISIKLENEALITSMTEQL